MTPLSRTSTLLLACLVASCGPAVAPRQAPNVLLISIDSARRDLFSAYGRRPLRAPVERTSPNLDRLAAEGVLFENASASTSWTLPSHLALLTGCPDLVHGVDQDGQRLSDEIPLLAEVLRANGYRTSGVYSGPYLAPDYGFGRGFERYESAYGEKLAQAAREVEKLTPTSPSEDARQAMRRLEIASHRDRSSARVTDRALEELDRAVAGGTPFFLFVHYFDPHYDYLPPAPFDRRFDPEYEGDIDGRDFIRDPRIAQLGEQRESVAAMRDLEHVLALYEGELAATDHEIGRLLDRLDETELAAHTVVVLVSDHGDEFFEHDGLGHRRTLFEEVLAVPLLLRYPDRLPAGRRVAASVSLTDVMPTLLDLTGTPSPAGLPSGSLLPLVMGASLDRPALGRLVTTREVTQEVQVGERRSPIDCVEARILETCRLGSLKVTRERRRLLPAQTLPPALARALEAHSQTLFDEERLSWVDLEEHPDEGTEQHSTHFTDPATRRALEAFQSEYARLLPLRRTPETDPGTLARLAQLRGLGYLDAEVSPGALDADDLRLPVPGDSLR